MAVSPGQVALGAMLPEVNENGSRINWPFCIAGHKHQEHLHLMHKNETSVTGKGWAHPGPVPTVGKVAQSLSLFTPRRLHLEGS